MPRKAHCLTNFQQIISSKPRTRRGAGRRTSARAQVLGSTAVSPVQRARAANIAASRTAKAAVPTTSTKIIVSNLPVDVNESQIKVCSHLHVLATFF